MSISGTDHRWDARWGDLLAMVADLELPTVLERTVAAAAEHGCADQAVLYVPDSSGDGRLVTKGICEADGRDLVEPLVAEPRPGTRVRRRDHPVTGRPVMVVDVRGEAEPVGLLVLARPWRGWFDEEDARGLSVVAGVADVAVRNAGTYSVNQRRREWLEAAAEVTESLHPPSGLGVPLNRVVEGASRITRACLAAVVRSGEHGYDVPAAVSPHAGALPALLDELRDEVREAQASGVPFERPYGERGTVVGMPLNPELAFEGVVVVVVDRDGGVLRADDRALLASFVTHGSLVLDRAVLLQERQQTLVAEDRDRIARDLHDVVVQRLFATGLKLQSTRHDRDPDLTHARVGEAVRELDQTIRDIRSTIFQLEHDRETSIRVGVAALVREYEPALGFAPTVRTWGPLNSLVGQPLAEQAMAVLREALSNCVRHAAADHCVVEVAVEDGWLSLEVVDDGRGLGDEDVHESGLRNLRRRAEALGGSLALGPASPRGTRFSWRVPVDDQ